MLKADWETKGFRKEVEAARLVERGTGRVLRYETADRVSDMPVDKSGNLQASVDGVGPPVQIDYTGTGFVAPLGR